MEINKLEIYLSSDCYLLDLLVDTNEKIDKINQYSLEIDYEEVNKLISKINETLKENDPCIYTVLALNEYIQGLYQEIKQIQTEVK